MSIYEKELQVLKDWDEVQFTTKNAGDKGYDFITTAGHGYLIVPVEDKNYPAAKSIAKYGFVGKKAIYLEEDCEAQEFIELVKG